MPTTTGRSQEPAMERLVRLITMLNGSQQGVPSERLLRAVAPEHGQDTARRVIHRDIEHLNRLGYDIRNVAPAGTDAVYRMHARDNRLQVHLTAEQRGELLRAVTAAGLDELRPHLDSEAAPTRPAQPAGDDALALVQRAAGQQCLVRFDYAGSPRVVHPAALHSGPSGWYLRGRQDAQDVVKEFVVSRMTNVSLDAPGSADPLEEPTRPSLDPLSWRIDPPTEVVLELEVEHLPLAENVLGRPTRTSGEAPVVRATWVVTNRRVFRLRVYELGTRVRLVAPADVRRELVAELRAFAAGPA